MSKEVFEQSRVDLAEELLYNELPRPMYGGIVDISSSKTAFLIFANQTSLHGKYFFLLLFFLFFSTQHFLLLSIFSIQTYLQKLPNHL